MKLLSSLQIREWDQYTIRHEPISSVDLMERAARKCVEWMVGKEWPGNRFVIFCGKGNNGGDGLAIARMLSQKECDVSVYILEFGHLGTEDFQVNLKRLHQHEGVEIKFVQTEAQFPVIQENETVIDALLGSGLNRPLEGITARLVEHINHSGCKIIAIDVPSGLEVDHSSAGNVVVRASYTLSFQVYKLSFLMQENAPYVGEVHLVDISLASPFYNAAQTNADVVDHGIISAIYKPRNRFAHKGNFGHALVIAGSHGKMGAAVLCTRACLRTGAGLTTTYIPACGYNIIQEAVPEAMAIVDPQVAFITTITEDVSKFSSIGIGPGIGTAADTKKMLYEIFDRYPKPVVLDADALNIISTDAELLKKIPPQSILTPHPKELERMFGKSENDFNRLELARNKAKELNVVIVLKSHYTCVATPGGHIYFNNTGNAGMAKGGSGDVLTGIITALAGQLPDTVGAAILGTYLHGLAGDIAAKKYSEEAMIAGDIIEGLGEAFTAIRAYGEPQL